MNRTSVPVTCCNCHVKFNKLDNHLIKGLNDGSFTGRCPSCYRESKRRSHLLGTGRKDRTGYIMRHRLTFTPEEWEIIAPMVGGHGRDYVLEHRAVVALSLGRALTSEEIVHHRDGVKDHNTMDNLQLVTKTDHSRFHASILSKLEEMEELAKYVRSLEERIVSLEQRLDATR